MAVTIEAVERGSPAHRCGISAGDTLHAIDGNEIVDVLDYRFYMTAEKLTLTLSRPDGTRYEARAEKDEYDDLGLGFSTYLMDKQRFCKNSCVFCFIDQMPKGMRETLYFKDDDSRMSFLFGNYITLTNLEERDVERIIAMHISPVNISVHTMNPELRVAMMKNPRAGEALRHLKRFAKAGITVNAQIVLCPEINDGEELARSLRELCALAPQVQSVAVVPVGLTGHREGLPELRLFTKDEAAAIIDTIDTFGDAMLKEHGARTCYAADEFYLKAERELPGAAFYGDFDQLENGVGLLALLSDEFASALADEEPGGCARRVSIATGMAAAPTMERLARAAMERFQGLAVDVHPVENDFFGSTITVAGLVTGGDLIRQLNGKIRGEELLFPAVMLRHEGDLFLDDTPVEGLSDALGVPVRAVANDGYELLAAMLGRGGERAPRPGNHNQ